MWLKRAVLFTIFLLSILFVQAKNLNEENYLIQVQDTGNVTEACKEIECKNGGTCTTDNSGNTVCHCREGSYGNLCDNVVACEILAFRYCNGSNGTCELGDRPDEAICKCNHDKKFHNTLHICKDTCKDGDCMNGANCTADSTGNRFCECRDGSSGDFCDTVYACKHQKFKYCKDDNGTCVLGKKSYEALCECHDDKKFDDNLEACRETCKDDDCKNGANCRADGTDNTFCECREGSSGDFCDTVYACRQPKFKYCKGDNGTCVLGAKFHEALCECHGNRKFDDNLNACREICNDDVCRNGANCTADMKGNKFCKCRKGSIGDFCDNVPECRRPKFKYCKGYNGTCVLGDKPSTAVCQCKETKEFDENRNECRENKCKISCGEKDDVRCNGDPYGEVNVICTCKDKSKEFQPRDKSCKENKCKISCGEKEDVRCIGDPYGEVDVNCTCKDESKEFDPSDKSCKKNKCKISCGEKEDVRCNGDPYGKVDVICTCEDKLKEFDPRDKSCKENKCKISCGRKEDVRCNGDPYGDVDVICTCEDNSKEFDPRDKSCKENKCKISCGEEKGVRCNGDPYGEVDVICTCKDESKRFDPSDKSCKENKCKIWCGEKNDVKCNGDPYGEVDVICICEDISKEFDPRDKSCKDINECENPSACPNTTYCVNTYGSYSCLCKDGFKQKSLDSIPKQHGCEALCDPNPCKNYGECIHAGSHGFTCRCAKPYGGPLCNETSVIIDGVPDNKYAIICGIILVALLVISIVVGIVLHTKMKKYKGRNASLSSELRRNHIEMNRIDCNEQHNFQR